MEEKVLKYLKHDRSFDNGKALYMQIGRNRALQRILNVQGDFGHNKEFMLRELAKDAGIETGLFESIMQQQVVPEEQVKGHFIYVDTTEDENQGNENTLDPSELPGYIQPEAGTVAETDQTLADGQLTQNHPQQPETKKDLSKPTGQTKTDKPAKTGVQKGK